MENDTISRTATINAFYRIKCNLQMMDDTQIADKTMVGLRLAENAVNELPTITAPVKHGKWIPFTENHGGLVYNIKRCSVCYRTKPMRIFEHEQYEFNFCPNCGATMDA